MPGFSPGRRPLIVPVARLTGGGPPPPGGPVSWWKFDDGSGTNAADSADSNPGAMQGSTYTWGAGFITLAAGDYAQVAYAANLAFGRDTDFTWLGWVKLTSQSSYQGLFNNYPTANPYMFFGALGVNPYFDYGGASVIGGATIPANVRCLMALTHAANTNSYLYYQDGVFSEDLVAATSGNDPTSAWYVGGDPQPFNMIGDIDNMRVYGSILTAPDILAIYNDEV